MIPAFAISIPRPHTWLIANGVRRYWVLGSDAKLLTGEWVALHSPAKGDADGYRRWKPLTEHTDLESTTVAQVREECPRDSLVGLAKLVRCERKLLGREWMVHFEEAHPIEPIQWGVAEQWMELWALPAMLREIFSLRRVG